MRHRLATFPKQIFPILRLALGFDRKFDESLKEIYHPSRIRSELGRWMLVQVVEVTRLVSWRN